MSLTLGEKLKQAREARGISISEVAEQTRISPLYIESIENDNYKPLPGGIFNKGFVKSYAKFVGIDDQEALQDYSRLMSSQGETNIDENKSFRPEVLTDDQARSTSLPTLIIAVIILGLLAGGVYFGINYLNSSNQQTASNNANKNTNANATTANTNATPAPTPVAAVSELKVELKAVGGSISVSHNVDGKNDSKLVTPDAPLALTGQNSIRISYYRGFTPDKVQLTLNGKQIAAPAPPAKGNIAFEITKENAAQILQSGAIPTAQPSASPATR